MAVVTAVATPAAVAAQVDASEVDASDLPLGLNDPVGGLGKALGGVDDGVGLNVDVDANPDETDPADAGVELTDADATVVGIHDDDLGGGLLDQLLP